MTVSEKSPTTPERDRQRTVTVTSIENSMNHVNGKGNDEEDMEIVKECEFQGQYEPYLRCVFMCKQIFLCYWQLIAIIYGSS